MKSYKEKRQEFSPEAQARMSAVAQEIKNKIRILRAIREASGLSQEELAERLEVGQCDRPNSFTIENQDLHPLHATVLPATGRVLLE